MTRVDTAQEVHAPTTPSEAQEADPAPRAEPAAPSRKAKRGAASAAAEDAPHVDPALAPHLEAILISMDRQMPALRLAQGLGLIPTREGTDDDAASLNEQGPLAKAALRQVDALVAMLNEQYQSTGRCFRIELLAGGYRVMTLPAFAPTLARVHARQQSAKLSRAAVETLAIIAYKQPMTRAELEAIRGVSCGEVLKTLIDRRLVTIKGRAEELGRPLLYGTTAQFLQHFGLASIKDLPAPSELKLSSLAGQQS